MMLAVMDHVGSPVHSINPTMRVMSLVIPAFLALSVGYVLYAVVDHVLIDQFKHQYNNSGLAIGLLVPYVVVAALMVASYLRVFITIRVMPGVVALGPEAARDFYGSRSTKTLGRKPNGSATTCCGRLQNNNSPGKHESDKLSSTRSSGRDSDHGVDLESALADAPRYGSTPGAFGAAPFGPDPRTDPDSPGLELFYTKDVFECTADGRPNFCSPCGTWKPDRTHHCSEINRCVRKMDHFCPWVGGIISETTFKFFLQFTYYATVLCALTIGTCAYAVWRRRRSGHGADAQVIVALALAGFLGFFSFTMAMVCTRFVFTNVTTVESHQLKTRPKTMAVRIQRGAPPVPGRYGVVTYPLPKDDAQRGDGHSAAAPQRQAHAGSHGAAAEGSEEPDPFKVAREARAARRAARDLLAFRTFAIVHVNAGTNVWDLGWRRNWTSVMGTNVVDWLTPFRLSPCCNHESTHSFYQLSPEFLRLCAALELPPCQDMEEARHF